MKEIESLYKLYKDDVFHYLLSLTRDPNLSEDLLSDTFVNAIGAIHNFKGQSAVKTWLFSIARNLWLSKLRRNKHFVEYNDLLGLYISENVSERIITNEIIERIENLLRTKDERTRQIIKMRVEGYSFIEISQTLNMSEKTARVIDFRTKKWLKTTLEKEGFR